MEFFAKYLGVLSYLKEVLSFVFYLILVVVVVGAVQTVQNFVTQTVICDI